MGGTRLELVYCVFIQWCWRENVMFSFNGVWCEAFRPHSVCALTPWSVGRGKMGRGFVVKLGTR